MNIVNLDLILLAIGLPCVVLTWYFGPRHSASQISFFASTVHAQYSWLVSWSLAKFCMFLLALDGIRQRPSGLIPFLPYVGYVMLSSLIASLFWDIPNYVSLFYGEARIFVSLFNFTLLVLSTMSLAAAFSGPRGSMTLWYGLRWLAVMHGLFSLYQYVAIAFGWPLIGISRPHGLTLDDRVADVAIFVTGSGMEILRPGGLAGEPKVVAVIFGMILFAILYLGHRLDTKPHERILTSCAAVISIVGFLLAYSTSAFFGFSAAFCVGTLVLKRRRVSKAVMRFVLVTGVGICSMVLWSIISLDNLLSHISERTIDRFGEGWDPSVEASLGAIWNSLPIALFGVGEGGSSFVIMNYLSSTFEYAYAPNIGFIRLAVENGLIGLLLFFGAYVLLSKKGLSMIRSNDPSGGRLLFFTISISAMCLSMSSSGIPLGIPLSIASMYAAQASGTDLESRRCAE